MFKLFVEEESESFIGTFMYNLVCFKTTGTTENVILEIVHIGKNFYGFFIDSDHAKIYEENPSYPNVKFWTL